MLLIGSVLRFAYYDTLHGQSDEQITVEVVRYMRLSGDWDVNWKKANVSPDLRYDQYNFSSHLYATYFFYRGVKLLPGTAGWRAERDGVLVYRFFVAALATLALVQTLQLGRRVGGWSVGLGVTLLAGVAPLLVQDAHYMRPEPFTTVLTLATVALCWPRTAFSAGRVLGAAFCLGLLVACKISMLLIAWLPLVPIVAGWQTAPRRLWWSAALPFALAAGFAVGAPTALANPDAFLHGIKHLAAQYAGLHPPHSHLAGGPVADMMGRYFAATLGWPVLLAGAVGIGVLGARRQWTELLLLAGPVVVFVGYFATRSVFFERNVSHVLPLFLLLSAGGIVWAVERIASRWRTRVALAVFALVAVTPARISTALVAKEFSGKGAGPHEAHEEALRARHPHAEWKTELLLIDEPLPRLAAHFQGGGRAVLMRVTDFHDEWTAATLAKLHARFHATQVADYPGTFPGLPVCTLLTYHSPTDRYLLITGLREAAPR